MAYQTSAGRYRELEVMSASPARLLIITFDFLLAQFARAKIGMETKNRALTLTALDKARQAVGELAETLDIPKGTVMSRLFHARKNFQKSLQRYLKQ